MSLVTEDPHAAWIDRTPLYDEVGKLIFMFTLAEGTRSGLPWADGVWRPDDTPVPRARDAALSTFAGHALSTSDSALAEALLEVGATELRHAHSMSHSLDRIPEVEADSWLEVRPLRAADLATHAQALGEVSFRAYPTDHPDHEFDDLTAVVDELRAIGRGEVLGPFLDVSTVARVDGSIVGACLVVDRDGVAPDGGPWIVDVFRDPEAAATRIGSRVIAASLAAAKSAGLASVSLAVSHTNANAVQLYTHLGFVDAGQNWTLAIP
jgi:ribosomal protein S18 acetylase RimI-like enzyme